MLKKEPTPEEIATAEAVDKLYRAAHYIIRSEVSRWLITNTGHQAVQALIASGLSMEDLDVLLYEIDRTRHDGGLMGAVIASLQWAERGSTSR